MEVAIPVDFTVYLPDAIGVRAKEAGLNLSRLLRAAVTRELERREAVKKSLEEPETFEVAISDDEGREYIGRINGTEIAAEEPGEVSVFLTTDERVIVYDGKGEKHFVLDNPVNQLRGWLSDAQYFHAMQALGEEPVIDL